MRDLFVDHRTEVDCDGNTYETASKYHVHDTHPMATITAEGVLLIDTLVIPDYDAVLFEHTVPAWYCVRMADDSKGYAGRFVCGLDLLDDGTIWLGVNDKRYTNIADLMNDLTALEGQCFICLEDPRG